jgi:uncharacterized membrane-anchored protein
MVLSLYNATTGMSANYVREDPPYLTRGMDIVDDVLNELQVRQVVRPIRAAGRM